MAKKDNSPAISFFSFQDIITSITGIMFLVVMMLVLLVVSRSTAPTAPEKAVDQKVAELRKKLAGLKAAIIDRSAGDDDLRRQVEALKKLDLTSLTQKKAALLRQLEELSAAIKEEKSRSTELTESIAAAKQEEAQEKITVAALETEIAGTEKNLKALTAQREILTRQCRQKEKLVRFVWQGGSAKRPLLAVCSGAEIAVMDGVNGTPLFAAKEQNGALTGQFLTWCRDLDAAKNYIVLVVKPAAFAYAEELSAQLKKLGLERGREILAADDLDLTGDN